MSKFRIQPILAAVAVLISVLGWSLPAGAADTDLVVNVGTDQTSYRPADNIIVTTEVTSRGPGSVEGPATLELTVPWIGIPEGWELTTQCVAENGAVCPDSYSRASSTMSTQIETLPPLGRLTFTTTVAGRGTSWGQRLGIEAEITTSAADSDTELETNVANTTVEILATNSAFAVEVGGPATAGPDPETVTYPVTISSTGSDPLAAIASVRINDLVGSGSTSDLDYFDGLAITGVTCAGVTGGADCADAVRYDYSTRALTSDLFDPEAGTNFGSSYLPSGSSMTFDVTVDIGQALCSLDGAANRQLEFTAQLTNTYYNFSGVNGFESPLSAADNDDLLLTDVPVVACNRGDLAVTAVDQDPAQVSGGLAAESPWAYTVTYTNLAGDTATDAPLSFNFTWPTTGVTVPPTIDEPICVASGTAQCPTVWDLNGSAADGVAPLIPDGGSLTVTYSGTTGGETVELCRPQTAQAAAAVYPPTDFNDDAYDPTDFPRWDNNRLTGSTQANIGYSCDRSHDDQVTLAGPYIDAAATIPLTGEASPGDTLYFRSSITNIDDDPQDPLFDFSEWYHSVSFEDSRNNSNGWGGEPSFASYVSLSGWSTSTGDPVEDRLRVSYQPGDPTSLPFNYDGFDGNAYSVPSGVRCVASNGGAPCPEGVGGGNSGSGGNGFLATNGFNVGSARTNQWGGAEGPDLPNASSLEFISTYRLPIYNEAWTNGTCSGYLSGDVIWNIDVNAFVSASTVPVSSERNGANDRAETSFPVRVEACDQTLAIDKTVLSPETDGDPDADVLDPGRLVTYQIVVTNTSGIDLDLPRLIDTPSPAPAEGTMRCVSTTLGAQCPDFDPQAGEIRAADGSTTANQYPANYDFTWGTAGQPTMPAGSSVTFEYDADYRGTTSTVRNSAYFTSSPDSTTGTWPYVTDRVTLTVASGPTLGLTKQVTPTQPEPGETVTFTVEIINYDRAEITDVYFWDAMHPDLQLTNPEGFASLECRALTAADGVLNTDETIGEATCPTFISDSGGITATIPSMPGYSGLVLTYTAVAPLTSSSAPNIAELTNAQAAVTTGDVSAQTNLSVIAVNVAGTVWHDVDVSASGTFENIDSPGEQGTPTTGLTAVLIDQVTGEVRATVPVADDGTYLFSGLPAGIDVTVAIVDTANAPEVGTTNPILELPATWAATTPLVWPTFNTGVADTFDVDFGVVQASSVGDRVWYDTDSDGTQDLGEAGVSGVTVTLTNTTTGEVLTTTTDADGNYLFDGLTPGSYTIAVDLPTGTSATTRNTGSNVAVDSDIDANGNIAEFTLDPNEHRRDLDAGIIATPPETTNTGTTNTGTTNTGTTSGPPPILARTGSEASHSLWASLGLLLTGAGFVLAGRRQRKGSVA